VHKAVCSSGFNPALLRLPADMAAAAAAAAARECRGGSRGLSGAAALPLCVRHAESSAAAATAAGASAAHPVGIASCGARSAAASGHVGCSTVPESHGRETDACLLPAKRSRPDAADEGRPSSSSALVHPAPSSAAPSGHRSVPASRLASADATRVAARRAAARSARCGAGSHATSLLTDLSFGPVGKAAPSLSSASTALRRPYPAVVAVRPAGDSAR